MASLAKNRAMKRIMTAYSANPRLLDHLLFGIARPGIYPISSVVSVLVLLVSAAVSRATSKEQVMVASQLHRSASWHSCLCNLHLMEKDSSSLIRIACRLVYHMSALDPGLLCDSLPRDAVVPVCRLLCNMPDPIACQTLIAFLMSPSLLAVAFDKGLQTAFGRVRIEAESKHTFYPQTTIDLLCVLRGGDVRVCPREISALRMLFESEALFGQAIAIKIAFEQVAEEGSIFSDKAMGNLSVVASLSWMLLHTNAAVVQMTALGISSVPARSCLASYFLKAGCVPILWISKHEMHAKHRRLGYVPSTVSNFYTCLLNGTRNSLKHAQAREPSRNVVFGQLLFILGNSRRLQLPWNVAQQFTKALARDPALVHLMLLLASKCDGGRVTATPLSCRSIFIIRSYRGDAKMSIPPAVLTSQYRHVELGKLPIIRGNYANLDRLFSRIADRGVLSPDVLKSCQMRAQDQIVDALCVSCCYHLDLPKHTFHKYLAQSLFSDCGLNYLVNMVLSALKYGASSLAVNAVLENNHVSCTPDNLGRNVNHLTS